MSYTAEEKTRAGTLRKVRFGSAQTSCDYIISDVSVRDKLSPDVKRQKEGAVGK